MSQPENPSAFPPHGPFSDRGMTLRDWFASQVDVAAYSPAATFETANGRAPTVDELSGYIVAIRFNEADAMLAERAKSVDVPSSSSGLLEALEEAHRALMHYEWYANPKSGWASTENLTVRGMVDAAIAKAKGGAA